MSRYVDPTKDQFKAMSALASDQPIHMLNLIRFRKKAKYDDKQEVSGEDAYKTYGAESGPIFTRVGGKIIWSGVPQLMLIGPEEKDWDLAFIAEYPNVAAFLEMVSDPDYQRAVKHRQAAVRDSRLIRLAPSGPGGGFAG